MKLSVIISSRNRCKNLAMTLESLQKASKPKHLEWEVVIVDNGSTDKTAEKPCTE